MALVGNIRDFGLSDFLYLVDRGYKTGGLHLSRDDEHAILFFDRGKLVLASRKPEDQTGELLIRLGKLDADQLAQVRQKAQNGSVTLTQAILDASFLSAEDLQNALYVHTEESVYGLFGWPDGEFRFEQNERPADDAPVMPVPVPVENLIMEGVRRIDEWGRIKERIPNTDMIVKFIDQAGGTKARGIKLAPEEWRVFARINGKDSLAQIAQKTNLSEFDVCRIVYGFLTAGLVDVMTKPRPSSLSTGRGQAVEAPKVKKSLVNRIINRIRGM